MGIVKLILPALLEAALPHLKTFVIDLLKDAITEISKEAENQKDK